MKTKLLTILLIFIVALPLIAAPPHGSRTRTERPMAAVVDNATYINANRILMFVTNHGNFCRDLSGVFGQDAGTFYPYVDNESINDGSLDDYILYASGLWVGGLVNGERRVIIAEYSDEYVPGPMDQFVSVDVNNDTTWTFNPNHGTDPAYRVYKLYSDSLADNSNTDYDEWPADLGAPVDEFGAPDMLGDQMLWAVYNDADPDQHSNDAGETEPLGIEIRQTTWAFDRQDALGEIIFTRFQVFNRGGNTIDECYFALWSDPDLGEYTDDLVGCDTVESIGYVYNSDNDDAGHYGRTPPCVGYDFFQGPLLYTGNMNDVAKMWGTTWPGFVNMGMTSFNKYINGTDPNDFNETYNYMRGLKADGTDYTNPQGVVTKFMHAGDPVKGTGDIDFDPADRRFMMSTGPITFAPGDSTEFVAAIIVGASTNRLTSISLMKNQDKFAQIAYDDDFVLPQPPAAPIVTVAKKNRGIALSWTDISEVDHGTYPFEGYMVFQGETSDGPWTQVASFDLVNNIVSVFDLVFDAETGASELLLVRNGDNLGVSRHIFLQEDHILGGPLRNITEYHYKVDAYTVTEDQEGKIGFRVLNDATVVSVRPQRPVAEESWEAFAGDTLPVTHIGLSDGFVQPIVIDHTQLTGNDYCVVFQDTVVDLPGGGTVDQVWHWENVTTGERVLGYQTSQDIAEQDTIIDGLLLRVSGAPLVGKDWDYASADPANLSPVALTDDPEYTGGRWFTGGNHEGELFFGGVFMEPNFWGVTSVLPPEYPKVEIRWRPMVSYTDLNGDGAYSIGEPYEVDDPALTQGAFMYTGFSGADYEGFFPVPFTAWDVDDPANPRQLNVCMRDRDGNEAWNLHTQVDDPLLPNGGDLRFNYTWICITDYDETGTYYGDGTGGSIDFWSYADGDGVWDGAWVMWLDDRGNGGTLAEECTFTLTPNLINTPADTFAFSTDVVSTSMSESVLDNITVAPNPFYLFGPYDPAVGNYQIMFQNLPAECEITIYNLAGEYINTVEKNDPTISWASWGVNTANGLPVASGIYLWALDAPGIGQKVGKIAVFTEVEVLQTY